MTNCAETTPRYASITKPSRLEVVLRITLLFIESFHRGSWRLASQDSRRAETAQWATRSPVVSRRRDRRVGPPHCLQTDTWSVLQCLDFLLLLAVLVDLLLLLTKLFDLFLSSTAPFALPNDLRPLLRRGLHPGRRFTHENFRGILDCVSGVVGRIFFDFGTVTAQQRPLAGLSGEHHLGDV